jgi:molybdopterin-guanine dinucleotide biosynthesis protein
MVVAVRQVMSCSYIPSAGDTGVGGAWAAEEVGPLAWATGSVSQVKLARHRYTVRTNGVDRHRHKAAGNQAAAVVVVVVVVVMVVV